MDISTAADAAEVISRAHARIHGLDRTDEWMLLKLQEETGELTKAYLEMGGRSRPGGRDTSQAFRGEVADVFAQLLVLARRFDVDIVAELEDTWRASLDGITPQDRAGIEGSADKSRADQGDSGVPGRGASGGSSLEVANSGEPGVDAIDPSRVDSGGIDSNIAADAEEYLQMSGTVNGAPADLKMFGVMPMNFDQVHRFAEPGSPALVPYELRAPISAVVAACQPDYADYVTDIVTYPDAVAGPGERWLRDQGHVPLEDVVVRAPTAFLEFMDVEAYQLLLQWEIWGILHSGNSPRWSIVCVDSCRLGADEMVIRGRCFAVGSGAAS